MNATGWAATSGALTEYRTQILDAVFEHSPIGKALVSMDGQFMAVNPPLCRMLGYQADELLRLTFQQITHPDDLQADLTFLAELTAGQRERYTMIKRYVHRDGHLVWAQLDVTMAVEDSGHPAFYIAQVQDVTERQAREQELRDTYERLRLALDATDDGIWDWPLSGSALRVSPQWQVLTGLTAAGDRVAWRAWLRQVHPEDRTEVVRHFRQHLAGERPRVDVHYRHRLPNEGWRWRALCARVSQWVAGRPARLTGTLRDIDERTRAQQDLKVLLDHLPAMIGYWDRNLHSRFGNHIYLDWFGKDARLLPGRHISEIIGLHTYAMNRPMMERALQGETLTFERRITRLDGQLRHVQIQYVPDWQDGEVIGFFAMGVDVTALRETQRALSEQQQLAHVTLTSIGDSVVTTDPGGLVTFLNPVAQRITGWTLEEAMGLPVESVMPLTHDDAHSVMLNPLRVALREQRVQGMASGATLVARDGRRFSVEDSAAPIFSEDGELMGGVIVFHDVTEKRALSERMTYLAQHDPLTGLPNRTLLMDRVQHLIQLHQRTGEQFTLAFLDLDGFKNVNDTLGHSAGDALLQQVGQRIRAELRASDTISRVGGDEFILLLPDVAGGMQAELITQRILDALRAPFQLDDDEIRITGSIGMVVAPDDGEQAEDLMRHADVAMYRAKSDGRNRMRFFNQTLESEQRERHRLAQALQQAVALEQFELAYQPKVDGRSNEVIGVEALLRWTLNGHPVSPAVFIPVAEESGHMPALGTWVLRAACQQGRAWLDAGHPLRVAVNVSALQFKEGAFLGTVLDVLNFTGLPANLLELEVTEGVLMHEPDRVHAVLRDLRGLGVHVSLDDFGTGYSSLSYLHHLPLDTLKIDRSFVTGASQDRQRDALLRSIINLGVSLNLNLIAEGVETAEERAHLLDCGCRHMQGYLFYKPVPAPEVTALLTAP